MKLQEIKDLTLDEVSEKLNAFRLELVHLKMKIASRQLEDTSQVKKKRKEIARLLTVQTEKSNGKVETVSTKTKKTEETKEDSKKKTEKAEKKEKKEKTVKAKKTVKKEKK